MYMVFTLTLFIFIVLEERAPSWDERAVGWWCNVIKLSWSAFPALMVHIVVFLRRVYIAVTSLYTNVKLHAIRWFSGSRDEVPSHQVTVNQNLLV